MNMRLNLWVRGGILLFFIISTLIFFMRIFFGLDFTDSFFHLNNALHSEEYHPFFFLSSLIIRGVTLCFGEDILSIRITNTFLLYLAIILPFLVNKRNFCWYDVLIISAGLIIISPLNANILGYDTFTVFMISLCFSLIYRWNSIKNYKILLLSFLIAVSVFLRLPNVILIFALGVYFLIVERFHISFILITVSIGLILLGYKIVYGDLDLLQVSLAQNEHHNPMGLLRNYLKDGLQVLGYIILISSTYWLWSKLRVKRYAKEVMVLILIPVLVLSISFSPYWINYALFVTATGISWCFYRWFICKEKMDFTILLFFLLLFVLPFGSNTGLLKASLGMVLFPFVYSIRRTNSQYWPVLLFVLIPIAIMEYLSLTYEDKAIMHLTEEVNIEKLSEVRTSEVRSVFLNNVNNKVQYFKEKDYEIIFYGDKSHIFKYLYPESITADTWIFFQPIGEILEIKEELDQKSVLFIMDKYPDSFSLENHLQSDSILQLDSILQSFRFTPHIEHNILYYTIEESGS